MVTTRPAKRSPRPAPGRGLFAHVLDLLTAATLGCSLAMSSDAVGSIRSQDDAPRQTNEAAAPAASPPRLPIQPLTPISALVLCLALTALTLMGRRWMATQRDRSKALDQTRRELSQAIAERQHVEELLKISLSNTANAGIEDAASHRNVERQLGEAERRLRDIADAMPAVIASFDVHGRCTFSNGLARKILRIGPGDHGSAALQVAMGALYEKHQAAFFRALGGERELVEGQIEIAGTQLDVKIECFPDRKADGELAGMYIIAQDQTALKSAERSSAAGEQRLRTITDNMPVLIAYIDRQERYQFCNATYTAWSGLAPDQVIGRRMAEIMRPEEYAQRSPQFQRTIAGERTEFDIETTWIGIHRHLHTIYLPDKAHDGSVDGVYVLVTDVTAMKNAEVQLELRARTDTLTGLPNRHAFNERLAEALARSRRTAQPIALFFLDIDKFKSINDTFGHSTGDDVLKMFAQRLRMCVRESDMVARLAGDEFVIVLENLTSLAGPQGIARKIIASMSSPLVIDSRSLAITTSIGIAYQADGNAPAAQLLASADKALYEAKDGGRDTFRIVAA